MVFQAQQPNARGRPVVRALAPQGRTSKCKQRAQRPAWARRREGLRVGRQAERDAVGGSMRSTTARPGHPQAGARPGRYRNRARGDSKSISATTNVHPPT